MRKYIKSMRQQYDNNSFIFKQAKKMFHYEPSNQGRAYCSKPSKSKGKVNEFKDDFSSVKDNKMESNQINESSWIAKLVNGIQQNSLEDLRVCSKQIQRKCSNGVEKMDQQIRSFKNRPNIVIIDNKKQRRMEHDNIAHKSVNTQAPTKKNSYNLSKKRSDTFTQKNIKTTKKNQSFQEHEQKEKSNTKSVRGSITQSKSMTPNVSQSVIVKSQINAKKDMGSKKKSLQNIYVFKGTQQSNSKSPLQEDRKKIMTLKTEEKMNPTEKKQISKDLVRQDLKFNQSISEMQEIKCITDKKDKSVSENEVKQKNICLLDDYFSEPLFQQPAEQSKKLQQLKVDKKIGSIRKNKKLIMNNREEKTSSNCSFMQESTEAMVSPKFSSNNLTLKETISQKPVEEEDYISAREQKQLIDKYLKTDYSFKCYTPLETQKFSKNGGFKKNSDKKYSYEINQYKSFQNTNRFMQTFSAHDIKRQNFRHLYEKQETIRQNCLNLRDTNKYSSKPVIKDQATIINYVRQNKQNYSSLPLSKVTNFINNDSFQPAKANLKAQIRQVITKEAYLHESMQSGLGELPSSNNSLQSTSLRHKYKHKEEQIKKANPSKYFYMIQNSVQKQENNQHINHLEQSCQKKPQMKSVQGSQKLIDRLNSKLNSYINQHNLIKQQQETEQWNIGEPTYRAMQLTFNELKKHRQFVQK